MNLNPIREIRAVGAVRAMLKVEGEIEPPFAFAAAARMEDDAYRGGEHENERGLEDEDPESTGQDDNEGLTDLPSDDLDSEGNVNYLA